MQGKIECTYDKLVELFGEPLPGDGDKTHCEWVVAFIDGPEATIATIYDWKEWISPKNVTDWHIGGFSKAAAQKVQKAVEVPQ